MKPKSEKLIDFKLYLITDRKLFTDNHSLFTGVEDALKGGVKAVQIREKELPVRELLDMAYRMREITRRYGARLFINDRVDVALAVEADGVHLGHSGMPADAAKKIIGEDMIAGVSTHSVREAEKAEEAGADFITLGPVYRTPSKLRYGKPLGPGILGEAKKKISLPIFAIGGIKDENISGVMNAGADGIALISGILASHDIKTTAEKIMRLLI